MRKSQSSHPNASRCHCHPPPNSKAGQHLGLPSYSHTQGWALLRLTAQQDREVTCTASALIHYKEFITPHCPIIAHLPLFIHTAAANGPKCKGLASALDSCSLPAENLQSLQPVLQQVWALHGSRGQAAPSTNYLCSQVHTHHRKNNPNIFVVVQTSSFLVHTNETNGIFFFCFSSWC